MSTKNTEETKVPPNYKLIQEAEDLIIDGGLYNRNEAVKIIRRFSRESSRYIAHQDCLVRRSWLELEALEECFNECINVLRKHTGSEAGATPGSLPKKLDMLLGNRETGKIRDVPLRPWFDDATTPAQFMGYIEQLESCIGASEEPKRERVDDHPKDSCVWCGEKFVLVHAEDCEVVKGRVRMAVEEVPDYQEQCCGCIDDSCCYHDRDCQSECELQHSECRPSAKEEAGAAFQTRGSEASETCEDEDCRCTNGHAAEADSPEPLAYVSDEEPDYGDLAACIRVAVENSEPQEWTPYERDQVGRLIIAWNRLHHTPKMYTEEDVQELLREAFTYGVRSGLSAQIKKPLV